MIRLMLQRHCDQIIQVHHYCIVSRQSHEILTIMTCSPSSSPTRSFAHLEEVLRLPPKSTP